ncbi:hypothetical protein AB0N05_11300 [Nocardia sp. NPDC051030]|uniref:hypothetical protein n=1 Tax=Nocardia sp. NPDC051030 TaxID=3155162 RepID=UPI00343989FF
MIIVTSDGETIVRELRSRAQRGDTPAEVATWLVRELGSVGNLSFQCISCMFLAFDTPTLRDLKQAHDWVGLGQGGTLTDDELNQMLTSLR